ncbi:MAG: cell division protein FtsL [Deltaproteobacteria bacterium]|nr:cell division protein FtsL [Deltaproteobacteria bacterium]
MANAGKSAPQRNPADKAPSGVLRGFFWMLMVCAFLGELFLMAWCRVQNRQIGYEISAAWERHERLTKVQERLKVELAHLESPERIMRIAEQELGLVLPGPEQVVVVYENQGA